MKNLFGSLLPFEAVLLLMGVVIFAVLVFLLVWSVVKQHKITALLPFFLVPVILVGYPSIQSVQLSDDGLSIQKYTETVNSNPSDTAARKKLSDKLAVFKRNRRAAVNEDALVTIANAQLALGRLDSASLTLDKGARLFPLSDHIKQAAQEVNRRIAVKQAFQQDVRQLSNQLNKLQTSPQDTAITANITRILSGLQQPTYVDASSALVIARAYAAMKQPKQSMKVVEQVLKTDPESAQAKKMKNDLMTQKLPTTHVTPFQQTQLQKAATVNTGVFKAIVTDKQ